MTETQYRAFVDAQWRIARRDLRRLLSEECERLGWSYDAWLRMRVMDSARRAGQRLGKALSDTMEGFRRLSRSLSYRAEVKLLVWPDGTVDRVVGDLETCLRGAGVETYVTVRLDSDGEPKGSVSFDHLRDERNPAAEARVTDLTGACLVVVGPAVFEVAQ